MYHRRLNGEVQGRSYYGISIDMERALFIMRERERFVVRRTWIFHLESLGMGRKHGIGGSSVFNEER